MSLSKEDILKADDLKRKKVTVPDWGGDIEIRIMTGEERDDFESEISKENNKSFKNFRARLLAKVICDESGKRIFEDSDIVELGAKSGKVLGDLFDAATKLNGISPSDVEDLSKN